MAKMRDIEQNRRIGRNLRALRTQQGLTLHDVAGVIGVSYQQLQKYETGANRLPLAAVPPLSDFFGVPADALFAGDATFPGGMEGDGGDALSLCLAIAAVQDPALRRKIRRVVEILAA